MLPTKFFDPPSGGANSGGSGNPGRPAPPPLGMTGVMCKIGKLDIPQRGTIQYQIFRPNQLKNGNKPPLVVLHGGPMIPCNYLLSLAYVIVDRAIIFYDQLGCGQSSTVVSQEVLTTTTTTTTSVGDGDNEKQDETRILDLAGMVKDLDNLIRHWKVPKYHLYAHSFGGILAFEYLKYCHARKPSSDGVGKCLSVILASTPTSVKELEKEVQRLCQELNTDDADMDDDEQDISSLPKSVPKAFREKHECRLDPTPGLLLDSFSRAGPKHLRGLPAIGNYVATQDPPSNLTYDKEPGDGAGSARLELPALVLRGQHDFVTESCVKGWDDLFRNKQYMTLAGCSHYGMLENEGMYGSVISSFLGDSDVFGRE